MPSARADHSARSFAELLASYCLGIAPGQQVLVRSTTQAAPLLLEVQRAVLHRAAWPLLRTELPGQEEGFFAHARDAQLDGVAPLAIEEVRAADALLTIRAPENTRALAGVDPARLARATRAREPLLQTAMHKTRCLTLWPTPALAQQAGMGLGEYAAFLGRALFLDRTDPVAAWRQLANAQAALIERLAGARELRVLADGTDLRLGVAGRTWINSDGRRNMPSGEVFTGPLEDSAQGTIRFRHRDESPRRRGVRRSAHVRRRQGRAGMRAARRGASGGDPGHRRPGRDGWARSASARTPRSTVRPEASCSTRRSAARSTSHLAAPIRRPAAPTAPPSTGTSSVTCAAAAA